MPPSAMIWNSSVWKSESICSENTLPRTARRPGRPCCYLRCSRSDAIFEGLHHADVGEARGAASAQDQSDTLSM